MLTVATAEASTVSVSITEKTLSSITISTCDINVAITTREF